MVELQRILGPLYKAEYTRSALKALIPPRYHQRLRQWFQPASRGRFIRSKDCSQIDALEISGTASRDLYKFRTYQSVQHPVYDVCKEALTREHFDLVIAEQVFEHILRPDRAAINVYQMLRPGGFFVISTPFLLKVHEVPLDLYRWTERRMRQLLETAGFNAVTTGSWGNRECLIADMKPSLEWTTYKPRRHSLRNEPQFAIVVWAFAEKRKLE